jgi:hypothetical protein
VQVYPKAKLGRYPETSVQDSVRRSFLTRIEGSAGLREIVMPVAATGVQAWEWRLVGVARQFEVYCVGRPRAETRGYRCLTVSSSVIWDLDLVLLSAMLQSRRLDI